MLYQALGMRASSSKYFRVPAIFFAFNVVSIVTDTGGFDDGSSPLSAIGCPASFVRLWLRIVRHGSANLAGAFRPEPGPRNIVLPEITRS